MTKTRSLFAAAALLAAASLAPRAEAQTTAIWMPATQSGNQNWAGPLGIDFDVNAPITITAFGVFDDLANGFATAKSVRLYDRTSPAAPIATLAFSAGTPGSLVGSYRFLALAAPVTLAAGFQGSIVADGYGVDPNYNTSGGAFPGTIDGGGRLTFVGGSRYDAPANAGSYPTIVDGGPEVRYGAGSFQFVSAVPEPATVALLGGGLLVLGIGARRRRTS